MISFKGRKRWEKRKATIHALGKCNIFETPIFCEML